MNKFFYIKGKQGLSFSGNFVDNRQKWVKFTSEEVLRGKPKFANQFGAFVSTEKFRYL
jgi:hypothetical protein